MKFIKSWKPINIKIIVSPIVPLTVGIPVSELNAKLCIPILYPVKMKKNEEIK